MKQYKKIYETIPDGKINLIARVRKNINGRYYFETSLNGKKFETNVNMPSFRTENEAYEWIEKRADWKEIKKIIVLHYDHFYQVGYSLKGCFCFDTLEEAEAFVKKKEESKRKYAPRFDNDEFVIKIT